MNVLKSFNNVLILGDSYSTFEGYIPEKYEAYYSKTGEKSDLHNVADTWWYSLITETNSNLVHNNSWSGSTICYTGYGNYDCSKTNSFIFRLNELIEKGFFAENEINTIFIFGGTNDCWANSPLGDFKYSDWVHEDLYNFFPAVCYLISTIKEFAPNAKVIYLINPYLRTEVINGIITACEHYSVEYIKFKRLEVVDGHPTVKGMQEIKNQILESIG